MDSIEKALELLDKRVLNIKGVSGIGIVDYNGDGKEKIEIAVQTDSAREAVLKITQEDYFKNYPISIISPGENKLL